MDRFLTALQRAEFERWTSSVDFASDAEANEFLISFKVALVLDCPPMSVLRASRGNKGFKDLEASVVMEVAQDRTIEHWMDGRVRRLRFATPGVGRLPARRPVPLDVAALICECTPAELVGYRVRAMPGHSELGLGDDEYDPLEVVAVYVAVGLRVSQYPKDRVDRFVVQFLAAPPNGEDWAVDVTPRSGKLAVVARSDVGELGSRRNMRWLRPDGAYGALRDLGYPVSPEATTDAAP